MDEEYITMGMAAWGKPNCVDQLEQSLIKDYNSVEFKNNLHIGLDSTVVPDASNEDLAASAQVPVVVAVLSSLRSPGLPTAVAVKSSPHSWRIARLFLFCIWQ